MSLRASRGVVSAPRDVVVARVVEKEVIRMAGWRREDLSDVQSSMAGSVIIVTVTDENGLHVVSKKLI